jgi:hypothetical protein
MFRIAALVAVLGAVLALSACSSSAPPAMPATRTVTVTVTPETTVAAAADPHQQQVNQAVALDGYSVDWSATGSDAFAFVSHVCNFMRAYPGGPNAINWHTMPIAGVMTPGGMAALVAGVPIQCPEYAGVIGLVATTFFPTLR